MPRDAGHMLQVANPLFVVGMFVYEERPKLAQGTKDIGPKIRKLNSQSPH